MWRRAVPPAREGARNAPTGACQQSATAELARLFLPCPSLKARHARARALRGPSVGQHTRQHVTPQGGWWACRSACEMAAPPAPLEYLIAASFMAAPGGLLFAKLIYPETEEPKEALSTEEMNEELDGQSVNVIDAAANGAASGLKLAMNVGAMLLAFVGLIALVNGLFSGIGGWFNHPELTLELILGYVFAPLAFLIGVPWHEAIVAGSFIGQKLIVNEFVAYLNFAPYLAEGAEVVLSEKTKAIVSFALCGFANLSSIAILLGGLGSLAPSRRPDIARFGLKAVLAATLSNLMSATIAGLFLSL